MSMATNTHAHTPNRRRVANIEGTAKLRNSRRRLAFPAHRHRRHRQRHRERLVARSRRGAVAVRRRLSRQRERRTRSAVAASANGGTADCEGCKQRMMLKSDSNFYSHDTTQFHQQHELVIICGCHGVVIVKMLTTQEHDFNTLPNRNDRETKSGF